MAEKGLDTMRRRVASVANHLVPFHSSQNGAVGLCNTSMKDSYHRVHGEVPPHEVVWRVASDDSDKEFTDIVYEKAEGEAIAKITINRPERRNAFRPHTIKELVRAFNHARDDSSVGVIILTGKHMSFTADNPGACKISIAFWMGQDTIQKWYHPIPFKILDDIKYLGYYCTKDRQASWILSNVQDIWVKMTGTKAFCSGGDQDLRTKDGYADFENIGRLNVLDLQVQIRRLPKPVIAMVAGYAVGGGHVLHMVCDLTIAADNAIFGQTGPKVGSFDAGYGSSIMSRLVGPKKAREMWFLTRFYTAVEAEKMGLVNTVVPLENLEKETVKWCREILRNSPTAIRVLKSALNAVDDGHAGLQELGGNATLVFYGTEEANEGKTAFMQRRAPHFSKFPRRP